MRILIVGAASLDVYKKAKGDATQAKSILQRILITSIALGSTAKFASLEALASKGRYYAVDDPNAGLQSAINKAVELICMPGEPV